MVSMRPAELASLDMRSLTSPSFLLWRREHFMSRCHHLSSDLVELSALLAQCPADWYAGRYSTLHALVNQA